MQKYLLKLIAFSAIVVLSCGEEKISNSAPDLPHILLIMVDDMGVEVMKPYGGTSYVMPNLEKFAQNATVFSHCYSQPLCTPSRVKLMTGKGNWRNYEKFGYLNPSEYTFGNAMQEAGYKTVIAGKWQLGGGEANVHQFGFEEFSLWQLKEGDFWRRYKNPIININGEITDQKNGEYGPDIHSNFILDFFKKHKSSGNPVFAYYPMALVHDPFQPTPGEKDYSEKSFTDFSDTLYFKNMVTYMDKIFGKLVTGLDSLDMLENTIVIFTGDNGTHPSILSRYQGQLVNGDKGNTTKFGTHVPLMVSWGKLNKFKVKTVERLVDFSDFLPTLSDLAKGKLPANLKLDGISFYPDLIGEKGVAKPYIYCDYNAKGRDFKPKKYAFNQDYKLYETGDFYRFNQDFKEQNALPFNDLTKSEKKVYNQLHQVIQAHQSFEN
ncbi:sulfatase-like hydrolase/transferase [Flexithrix dorotheae]|uniref:sulfatase-like hydrolase/transferase n=1 Tax=Flexithrix dorotheae TaxID=70993 RepID=UPI00037D18EA|nr:sulfatase-like hydrolase/transferase [Flexithrix dorotheae]